MRIYSLLGLLALSLTAQSAVYKWVDSQGKVHYSDKPQANASIVEIKESSANQIRLPLPTAAIAGNKNAKAIATLYQIRLLSPEIDETIRNNEGKFEVSADVTPQPPANALWVLRIDGNRWGDPLEVPLFRVEDVDRGEHSIQLELITPDGKVIGSSDSRTVFLHRASLLSPVNKPAAASN